MDILKDIKIDDHDIDWVESMLCNISFDECRRNIIKNLDVIDIQAFPGTGKTTVLIAKLAILAAKWPYEHRGLCVLSHTNVAREEIEDRLGQTSSGRKLLSYPHFIGTFHSFFDSFISMPWIKSQGIKIKLIDNDLVLNSRWKRLSYNTRSYLEKKGKTNFCCQAINIPLKIDIGCSESTKSHKEVLSVVNSSHLQGEFTFNEMLLIANDALSKNPLIMSSLQHRFPIILIDEAQDTSLFQWELINKIFPKDNCTSVQQSFGDSNQAIYNSYQHDGNSTFPKKDFLTISNSKRFNDSIANLANNISLTNSKMKGEPNEFEYLNGKHTIFLFTKSKITSVVPAYANHLLECFSDETIKSYQKLGCHVIGMVHSESIESDLSKFPKSVCDYWSDYNPNLSSRSRNPDSLIECFRLGQQNFIKNSDTFCLIESICIGLRRYINMNVHDQIPTTNNAFKALCYSLQESKREQFRKILFSIIFNDISIEENWRNVIDTVHMMMLNIFDLSPRENSMLTWKPLVCSAERDSIENTFIYTDAESQREIQLEFGSIHSVKGRTHLSTLLIETFWHKSNIESLIPWLINNPPKKIGKQNETRMKCHYVGLTRAKALICLALPIDSVDNEMQERLMQNGWNIKILE